MKLSFKYLLLFLSLLFIPFAWADEWDDFPDVDNFWDGQKPITNQEFEEVIDALEAVKNKSEEKAKKKRIKKISGGGTALHIDIAPEENILELDSLKKDKFGTLINVPVSLLINEKILDKGYYNVIVSKNEENSKYYISFYQSQYLIAKTEVHITNDDFDEKEINFAKIKEYKNSHALLIYGSIDYNAYVYLPYRE